MLRIAAVLAALTLAACEPPPPNACQQATKYGEMFGTPENRGPCWGRVIGSSQMANVRSYTLEFPQPSSRVASIMYEGDRLIGVSIVSVPR